MILIKNNSLNNQEDQVTQIRNLRILKSQLFEKSKSNGQRSKDQFGIFK